jgi:glycosyltransferase involved in cell wall biosynthesis
MTGVPDFSIILPTYNRAPMIARAVESVLRQRHGSWELVVVDDGSTDDTRTVVERFADPRIRYFWKPNEERSIARNFGIDRAAGEFVTFLDSDDLVLESHLATALECIRANPTIGVFHLGYAVRAADGAASTARRLPPEQGLLRSLLRENPLSTNAVFVRRELLRDVRFPESRDAVIGEDWAVWLRLAARHPLKLDGRVTSCVVSHPGRTVGGVLDPEVYRKATEILIRTVEGDAPFRAAVGAAASRWFRAYALLGIGQHFLINEGTDRWAALRYVARAVRSDPRVLFTRRFGACLKKLLSPRAR